MTLTISRAITPAEIGAALRFRHRIFCAERNILAATAPGVEVDKFDASARHIVARAGGEVVGTARLVLAWPGCDLPMLRYCGAGVLAGLPARTTGEMSRFAVARVPGVPPAVLRLAIMRGLLRLCVDAGVTHGLALVEPPFARLLRAAGITTTELGPLVQARGLRQPVLAMVADVVAAIEVREAA